MFSKQKDQNTSNDINYKNCLNCGTELNGKYCHVCGQQATSPTPSTKDFVMEYLYNAYIWDPKFIPTLWTLISRPGKLTKEFLAGKFVSYVHPLKLNMFLLFVFITLFLLFSGTEKMNSPIQEITTDEKILSALQLENIKNDEEQRGKFMDGPRDTVLLYAPLFFSEEYSEFVSKIETIEDTNGESLDKWVAVIPHQFIEENVVVPIEGGYYQFNSKSEENKKNLNILKDVWLQMVDIGTRYFPMLILLTAPFLSISLRLVQHRHKCPYIQHFIFALHYTALLELLIIFIYTLHLINAMSMDALEWIMMIVPCTYLTVAFHKAYEVSSWFKSIIKAMFTSMVYMIILFFIFIGIFFMACATVAL